MIYEKDIIIKKNTHKVDDVFYPTYFVDIGGRKHSLVFTAQEVDNAQKRANNEIIKIPWWKLW